MAGAVAVGAEASPELLREERRDRVVASIGIAGEDLAERRAVVRRGRPVLDPPMAAVERVEELGDVAHRVHAVARRSEALVDDDAALHVEAGVARELDVRLDADPATTMSRPGCRSPRGAGRRRSRGRSRAAPPSSGGQPIVANSIGSRTICVTLHADHRQRRGDLAADEAAADHRRRLRRLGAAAKIERVVERAERERVAELARASRRSRGRSCPRRPSSSDSTALAQPHVDALRARSDASSGVDSPRSSRFVSGGRWYGPCGSCDQSTMSSVPPASR